MSVKLTVAEAKAVLACAGGVQVWARDTLETLDGVSARQPAHDPLIVRLGGEAVE